MTPADKPDLPEGTTPQRTRPLPKVRKAWGTSTNIDGEVLAYTEAETATFGDACFQDGRRAAIHAMRVALSQAGLLTASTTDADRIQAEEQAWGDYNAGRGPHPTRSTTTSRPRTHPRAAANEDDR